MAEGWAVVPLLEGSTYSSSCTLVSNGSCRVIVDTALSLQEADLRRALADLRLTADDVDYVVNTHLHIDHCGNNVLFRRARVMCSRAEWDWTHRLYAATMTSPDPERVVREFYPELTSEEVPPRMVRTATRLARMFWNPDRLGRDVQLTWIEDVSLPPDLELLETPGHTPHHVSLLVHGAEPVLVAGDAILHEDALARVRTMVPYSRAQFEATRRSLLALGVRTIPGHGAGFVPSTR